MPNAVIDSLMAHRSIRKFKPQPVEPEVVETILRAGIRGATSGNFQQYALLVVDDTEKKKALGLEHAPLVIIALVDHYRISRWLAINEAAPAHLAQSSNLFTGFWDAIIALQNIVVAAESIGLGTCYIGRILQVNIQELFHTPEYVFPAGMVIIGYPDESPALRMRLPLAAVVHRNDYQIPADEEIREWYKERDEVWNTMSEEQKEPLRKQGIHSIAQVVAAQKYSAQFTGERSKGIVENLRRAKFVLTEEE